MNTSLSRLSISLAVAASAAALITGCNRQDPISVAVSPTTVGMELDDTVITTRVKSVLLQEENIKGFDIKVETRKGMVLLSGFVDSAAQADLAMGAARAVEGVKEVENGMTVKTGTSTVGNQLDDGIVTAKVHQALLADPSIKSAQIAVATVKGEVQLSGFVDTQAQIDQAQSVARSVEGVRAVVNQMSIKK